MLEDATDNLAKVLGSADPIAVEEPPDKMIEENEAEKVKIIIRVKFIKEIKEANELVGGPNVSEEIQPVRDNRIQRRFSPDQTLKPKLLDEGANLLEVKDFIIEFKDYILSGYNPGEKATVGHYVQMRNIMEHSWTDRLDRRNSMEKDLDELCVILHEEAEKKCRKHQRRISCLK